MINKRFYSSFVFLTLVALSSQDLKDDYFESLIDFLYENYPDFIPRLLAYNGTRLGKDIVVCNSTAYKGGVVMETKFPDGYGVYVANSLHQYMRNGLMVSSSSANNVMYKCDEAIRYCSGNPAYCRYHEGEKGTQLILVAGHDGPLKPNTIPDRGTGCLLPNGKCLYKHNCEDKKKNIFKNPDNCKVKDLDDVATTDIAVYLTEAIARLTGKRPHLIVSRLHRKKLDINREIGMGTFHVDEAIRVYEDVHNFIKRAKASLNGKWGMILDIHGNNLPEKWTMLGYGVLKYQFDKGYFTANDSTIGNLAERANINFEKLIRGKNSLGHLMEGRGINVIPSPQHPSPHDKNYLTGGFITRHYGSKSGGNVDAIQIEIPVNDRDNKDQKEEYLTELAESIVEFIDMNHSRKGELIDKV